MNSLIRNTSGFSLLQTLIAAGMMGGIALGYAKIQKDAATASNLQRFQSARNEIRMSMVSYLQNQTRSCSCSLSSVSFNPTSMPANLNVGSTGFHIMGALDTCTNPIRTVMDNKMNVENAKIKDMRLVILNGMGDSWSGELRIDLEPTNKVADFAIRPIVIPMDVQTQDVGANKQIQSCIKSTNNGGAISFDPAQIGDSHTPQNGNSVWDLSNVPDEATAVTVRWLIGKYNGSGKGDRRDRHCLITSKSGVIYTLGHNSYGDGKSYYTAGTSILRLGAAPHSFNLNCSNGDSQGFLVVDGVIF